MSGKQHQLVRGVCTQDCGELAKEAFALMNAALAKSMGEQDAFRVQGPSQNPPGGTTHQK
eukprot:1783749-Amphidinium_carterae.1